jgi:hypothetical protein
MRALLNSSFGVRRDKVPTRGRGASGPPVISDSIPSRRYTTSARPECCRGDRRAMRRQAAGVDVVRDHVGVVGEFLLADRALAMLEPDLPVHQLAHFTIRTQLPVAAWMMRVLNPADTHLPRRSLLRNRFPATAKSGMVDRAKLVATKSHRVLLEDIVVSARCGWQLRHRWNWRSSFRKIPDERHCHRTRVTPLRGHRRTISPCSALKGREKGCSAIRSVPGFAAQDCRPGKFGIPWRKLAILRSTQFKSSSVDSYTARTRRL